MHTYQNLAKNKNRFRYQFYVKLTVKIVVKSQTINRKQVPPLNIT